MYIETKKTKQHNKERENDMRKPILLAMALATTLMFGTVGNAESTTKVDINNLYTDMGIVTEVNYETDIVTVNTFSEEYTYIIEGCEDWYVGDFATFLMTDMGTPYDDSDDEMISATYSGHTGWISTGRNGFLMKSFDGEDAIYNYYLWED